MKTKKNLILIAFLICTYILVNYMFPSKTSTLSVDTQLKDITINNEKKIIYLTFDDGPSVVVTNKILDTLKEQNVKATFFLVGSKIQGREDILKRIHTEGHTIGLHTYTHKYRQIYSSEDAFIEEMDKTSEEIKKIVNIEPKAIRFPSGSKKHLSASLLEKLHQRNYKIYDWNLSLSDGIDYNTSSAKLYKEATKKCINPNRIFLLAHCDQPNKNTCDALPNIIKYYKDLGYEFQPITNDTLEYHFRVSK
ncbi:polysaccharide deacetylase family protein [Clostridium magnum]|uniref:Peptidoglycan-N-acetylglucosamine deacetylase n=1 Tax=Clostridium magnum DSM 2767 TaxID=1121326 RepID=A0A162T1Q7_9CLOT|nr:polysaccharide deacetylase family protein [Clostridium magnum]KZL92139.1 peptidoglycan-N-acetylglucosamine deacetylase [Clostridium magnum DSM 2767]SHH20789.1 Peptidoglycan/xylan/chitin deacetylase, PgdA/CDA1 family [Clostridium magnum DSM 2767]